MRRFCGSSRASLIDPIILKFEMSLRVGSWLHDLWMLSWSLNVLALIFAPAKMTDVLTSNLLVYFLRSYEVNEVPL